MDGQVALDWMVPAGGSDTYRIFRGEAVDLAADRNGGSLHASSVVNAAQFPDELERAELAFYLVAGVRDEVQGSVGLDSLGQERSITSP